MSVEVKEVTKIYGTQKALDRVSFVTLPGRITGFLGPNGAGKTTMMKIITGFLSPSSGDVFVNGMNIVTQAMEVKKIIGYLPENNPLYPDMYIKEYLHFTGALYHLGRSLNQRIEKMIEITGLGNEQHKKIGALSKGYRQRVGLAQALIHDPQVLILDEPTSGLDPNQIIEIRGLIAQISKEKSILLSTHIMQEVEAICHDIIIIHFGKIIASDATCNIQQKSIHDSEQIEVEFDKQIDIQLLGQINGVKNCIHLSENKYIIHYQKDVDVRPGIFQFAVTHQLMVLSMHKQEKSLEQIFQQLTTSNSTS